MKIALIEPSKTSVEHLSFNHSLAQAFLRKFTDDVTLFSSTSHASALGWTAKFVRLPVISITRRIFFRKLVVELFALAYAFLRARLMGYRKVIILSVFTPLIGCIPLLARLFGVSAHLILHGELDGLQDSSRQKLTSYGFWIKRFFDQRSYRGLNCVVLGNGIRGRLCKYYPDAAEHLTFIEHPIDPIQSTQARDIAWATFGIATSERFGRFYGALMALPAESRPSVAHIGICDKQIYDSYHAIVDFQCMPGQYLSRESYELTAARVCNSVALYCGDEYQMRVSGAMLDALRAGTHLVSLPNGYAEDLREAGFTITIVPTLASLIEFMMEHANSPPSPVDMSAFSRFSGEAAVQSLCDRLGC